MGAWRKVIVSGSTANLANVQVDGLTSGQVVIGGGSSNLSTTAINGSGTIVATTNATGLVHSGSFSGSFQGNFVGTTNLPDLTQGTGITAFTYDGATTATVAVSGASTLSSNNITKWTGTAFASSSLTDNGTAITGASSIQLTGASSNLSGSFSGSFKGDGSGLNNVNATAIFPSSQVSNITSTDKFFISQSSNQYITYGDLLTDLAGTNLTVEGTDSLTLATTITGLTSVSSTTFVGNLTGTATTASFVTTAQTASFVTTAQTASYVTTAQTASFVTTAQTASYVNGNIFTSTNPATSASYAASVNNLTNAITSNTDNRILTATGTGTINGESNLSFDGTTLSVTGNATLTGNLTVAGTASFTNTDNLNIRDKFILINSGSTTLADSGWITQYNAAGSGSAFYLDAGTGNDHGPYGRFATAFDTLGTTTTPTVSEYVVTAKINQASAPSNAVPPTWGTGSNGGGNMWVTTGGDIYIYS